MLTSSSCRHKGELVAAEAVVEHPGRVAHRAEQSALASGRPIAHGLIDQPNSRGLATAPGRQDQGVVPDGCVACRGRDGVGLLDQFGRGVELAGVHVHTRAIDESCRQQREGADFTGDMDRTRGEVMPHVVVPHFMGGGFEGDGKRLLHPAGVRRTVGFTADECERFAQCLRTRRGAMRDSPGKAVE
ncbi:Uncharacterised protein [Mycobacteroides abscessus subsp. abscessus]|nr:Uncharacterised protein [Mycobacteroides abscessus subsp. abscessus]